MLRSYRIVNTPSLCLKNNPLIMYREIIVVCSDIHIQHINAVCGHNVAGLNTKFKNLNTFKILLHRN